jgi:hypothetical protein
MGHWIQLSMDCPDGRTCPAVKVNTTGRVFAMQGRLMSEGETAEFNLGPGEAVIELPISVVEEAMDAYRISTG